MDFSGLVQWFERNIETRYGAVDLSEVGQFTDGCIEDDNIIDYPASSFPLFFLFLFCSNFSNLYGFSFHR